MKKIFGFLLICILIFSGCSGTGETEGQQNGPYIYYVDSNMTSLYTFPVGTETNDPDIDDYIKMLSEAPAGSGVRAPLGDITILETEIKDKVLTLDLGREYQTLSSTREILTRAAIVKTLTQIEDVNQVEFLVGGVALTNAKGDVIGAMDKDKFVDYFGKEQEALLSENLTIYYIYGDGGELIAETHRVYFENTLSLEQAVIKCMKENPENNGARCAITQNTNIINITTTDGVCYLDMDMSFYDPNSDINPTVAVNAIVNSLCELDNVRHVQVNIINPTEGTGQDSLVETLSGTYEKNMDIVRTE